MTNHASNQHQHKNHQPQVVLQAEHLMTDENRDFVTQGISYFAGRLMGIENGIKDKQSVVPLACELYMNFASLQYKQWGKEEEAKALVQEGLAGFSLAVLELFDNMHFENTDTVERHEALVVAINDNTKSTLEDGQFTPEQMGEVTAKGVVLISYDPIHPVHFLHLLKNNVGVSINEEGVSAVVLVSENGDMNIAPYTNKEILEQIEEYQKLRAGLQ